MNKIAIIGASYLQLPAVKKAKEMGLNVICFAWPEGAVCQDIADKFFPISITEKELILEVCRQEQINGITTVASDLAVSTVNYVAKEMNLIANPYEWTDATTNKFHMREQFKLCSIPSPQFTLTKSSSLGSMDFHFPLIIKPTDRSGSRGVFKVDDSKDLSAAIESAINESFSKEVIIEEFIDGQEVSVESISYKGKHYIIQITDKVTTGAPHFVELEHHQPSHLSDSTQAKIRNIVSLALSALHIEFGASHSELKISPTGDIKVIEIGARGGGDFIASNLVQLSTGYDFMKAIIDVCLGTFTPPANLTKNYSGVYFLSNETRRLIPVFNNLSKYPDIIEASITDNDLHDITCSGERSGYLIYSSNSKLNL